MHAHPLCTMMVAWVLLGGISLAAAQHEGGTTSNSPTQGHPNSDQTVGTPQQLSPNSAPGAGGSVPGATGETMPAKFSAENDRKDKVPLAVHEIDLSDDQRKMVFQSLDKDMPDAATASGRSETPLAPGTELPDGISMHEFPPSVVTAVPAIRDYKYVKLNDRILVVAPANRIVVAEINR
jgi:hypothetical protein